MSPTARTTQRSDGIRPSDNELRAGFALARRSDRGEFVEVAFDASRLPDVPPFLWKWRTYWTTHEVPLHGEPGVCYWVACEDASYLWVGELQVMRVHVTPPPDVKRKALASWLGRYVVGIDYAQAESRTVAVLTEQDSDGGYIVRDWRELYGLQEEEDMLVEDQLDPDARRRLEALAQAIAYTAAIGHSLHDTPDPASVVEFAVVFDKWIEDGKPEVEDEEESSQ